MKIFFQGQLLSVGIHSLLTAMYWKSLKVRIMGCLYKSFRGITSFRQLCIGNGRNGHFSVFPKKTFPLPLITTGESGIMLPSISYSFLNLQIPNFREYSRNIFLLGAIAFSRYLFPSGSYVFERDKNPNLGEFFKK